MFKYYLLALQPAYLLLSLLTPFQPLYSHSLHSCFILAFLVFLSAGKTPSTFSHQILPPHPPSKNLKLFFHESSSVHHWSHHQHHFSLSCGLCIQSNHTFQGPAHASSIYRPRFFFSSFYEVLNSQLSMVFDLRY